MGLYEMLEIENTPKDKFYREMWASLLTYQVIGLLVGFFISVIQYSLGGGWNFATILISCLVTTLIWIALVVGAYVLGWISGRKEKK